MNGCKSASLGVALALSLLAAGPAAADTRVGGKLGLAASTFAVQTEIATGAERVFRPSLTLGGFVHVDVVDRFGLQVELSGTNRGPGLRFDGSDIGHYTFDYLDLAVLGTFEARVRPLSVHVLAGPTAHYLVRARFENISGDTPVVNDISDMTARYDLGITAGAGLGLGPYAWGGLLLEARYTVGFIDVDQGSDDVALRNRTMAVTLGYQYRY